MSLLIRVKYDNYGLTAGKSAYLQVFNTKCLPYLESELLQSLRSTKSKDISYLFDKSMLVINSDKLKKLSTNYNSKMNQ